MAYRALNEKVEKKMKLLKRIALCIFTPLFVALIIYSSIVPPESWKYYFSMPSIGEREDKDLRIHFLDVGQGDCTLIEFPDGKVMLIDGGNPSGSTRKTVLRYLNALDIDVIDYLLVTHTDADHCGAIEEVFKYKEVLNAYLPPSFEFNSLTYTEAYAAAEEEGCAMLTPKRGLKIVGGEDAPYSLRFLYPYDEEVGGEIDWSKNEFSVVCYLEYAGTSALLCGDAPIEVEEKLVREDKLGLLNGMTLQGTEILKVGHHGSNDSTSAELLEYLGVKSAIISCGKANPYHHPSDHVLDRLYVAGATAYRTDLQGHLLCTLRKDGEYTVEAIES